MLGKLKRHLILSLGLGAAIFVGLSVYADLGHLATALRRVNPWAIPAALALALGNYLIRLVRWNRYLDVLDIPLSRRDSIAIFFAGLVMSVTPGKAGELLKAVLVRERTGTPVTRTAPVVLAERITDFVALILLGFIGIFSSERGLPTLIGCLLAIGSLLGFLGWPRAASAATHVLRRFPVLGRLADPVERAYSSVRVLISPRNLTWGVLYGAAAWFAECLAYYCVLRGFGIDAQVVSATFIYSFATLVGAVSMLPGGLGPTEGSMSGLLVMQGAALADAVASTFVVRVCTLWFAVGLGGVVLLKHRGELVDAPAAADEDPPDGLGRQLGSGSTSRSR